MAKRRKRKGHRVYNRSQAIVGQEEMTHALPANHRAPSRAIWAAPDGPLGSYITRESQKTLEAYRSQSHLIAEHANHEEDTACGGYAHRQLFELVQNSADSLAGLARIHRRRASG